MIRIINEFNRAQNKIFYDLTVRKDSLSQKNKQNKNKNEIDVIKNNSQFVQKKFGSQENILIDVDACCPVGKGVGN